MGHGGDIFFFLVMAAALGSSILNEVAGESFAEVRAKLPQSYTTNRHGRRKIIPASKEQKVQNQERNSFGV